MAGKEEKKRRKKIVSAIEQKQHAAEISRMPISIADLKALFEFLNIPGRTCDHSHKSTLEFLNKQKLDAEKIIPWLEEYGGYCDCEVVFNVEESWGEYVGVDWGLDEVVVPKKKAKPRASLELSRLNLTTVLKEWKVWSINDGDNSQWYMTFGKKGLRIDFIGTFLDDGDLNSDAYWIKQWTELKDLPLEMPFIVERGQLSLINGSLQFVTVFNQRWTPVFCWIYNPDDKSWYMRIETELRRKQNDFREVMNLMKNMELR